MHLTVLNPFEALAYMVRIKTEIGVLDTDPSLIFVFDRIMTALRKGGREKIWKIY